MSDLFLVFLLNNILPTFHFTNYIFSEIFQNYKIAILYNINKNFSFSNISLPTWFS